MEILIKKFSKAQLLFMEHGSVISQDISLSEIKENVTLSWHKQSNDDKLIILPLFLTATELVNCLQHIPITF